MRSSGEFLSAGSGEALLDELLDPGGEARASAAAALDSSSGVGDKPILLVEVDPPRKSLDAPDGDFVGDSDERRTPESLRTVSVLFDAGEFMLSGTLKAQLECCS